MNKHNLYIAFFKETSFEVILFILNTHISLIFNIVSKFDLIKNKIIIRVCQTYRICLSTITCLVYVAYTLRFFFDSGNVIKYKHGCKIVYVGKIILIYCCVFSQFHFMFSCLEFMYCALKNSSPAVLIFPSQVVPYCIVQASDNYLIK